MVRALRRTGLVLALPALVGVSTLAHWLAGQRLHGLWIMPDEAIYAARAETLWRHGPWPLLHGAGAGYGVLYPLLAGLPLSVGNFAHGYDSLKLLQALVMSLSAVPVFVYGRRLMPPGYALLAAALTVSSPAAPLLRPRDDRGPVLSRSPRSPCWRSPARSRPRQSATR